MKCFYLNRRFLYAMILSVCRTAWTVSSNNLITNDNTVIKYLWKAILAPCNCAVTDKIIMEIFSSSNLYC